MTITFTTTLLIQMALCAVAGILLLSLVWRSRRPARKDLRQSLTTTDQRQSSPLGSGSPNSGYQAPSDSPPPPPFTKDDHLPPLPAGYVRAASCPPGMVEVKTVMPDGRAGEYDEMHRAMSAHEGGQGAGVSLVDQRKNSASHLGGD